MFATYWALDQAIKTSPGGVADPKQIAILEIKGNQTIRRELFKQETDPIEQTVKEAENRLRDLNNTPPTAEDIPKPAIEKPEVKGQLPAMS